MEADEVDASGLGVSQRALRCTEEPSNAMSPIVNSRIVVGAEYGAP